MSEIDPELDATWRAASREQPPAAVDEAIRAAARREVGAGPDGFRAAPRWWPLAVAATVAAIALGIVQMAPPEQVTPAAITAANNTATDVAQRDVKPDTDKPSADRPRGEASSPAAAPEPRRDASKPTAKERRSAADENDRGVLRNRSDRFAAAPGEQVQEKKALDSRQVPPQRVEEAPEREQDLKQKTELAAASSAARPDPGVSNPPAASAARNELQPFPAAPAPAEPGASNLPRPMAAAAPAAAPAPAPTIAAHKLGAQSSATGALTGNATGSAEPAPAEDTAALGRKTAGMTDRVALERRKDLAPLAADEWIKRIRRLIAEGKNDDAAKELVAFRREYKERSEALLPSDLRAFRK